MLYFDFVSFERTKNQDKNKKTRFSPKSNLVVIMNNFECFLLSFKVIIYSSSSVTKAFREGLMWKFASVVYFEKFPRLQKAIISGSIPGYSFSSSFIKWLVILTKWCLSSCHLEVFKKFSDSNSVCNSSLGIVGLNKDSLKFSCRGVFQQYFKIILIFLFRNVAFLCPLDREVINTSQVVNSILIQMVFSNNFIDILLLMIP